MNILLNKWSESFTRFFGQKNESNIIHEPVSRRSFLTAATASTLALISTPIHALEEASSKNTKQTVLEKLFEIDSWLQRFDPKAKQEINKLIEESRDLAKKTKKKDPYNIFILRSISKILFKNGYKFSPNTSNHFFSQSLVNKELNSENLSYLTYAIAKSIKPKLRISFANNKDQLYLLINPKTPAQMLWQANIYNKKSKIFDSLKHSSSASKELSQNQVFSKYINKASLYFKGQNKELILKEALQLDKHNDLAHFNYARLYHSQGQNEKAMKHLNKAIEINPNNDSYYKERADYHFENDSFIDSFLDLQKAYKLNPKKHQAELYTKLALVTTMVLASGIATRRSFRTYKEIQATKQGDNLFEIANYAQAAEEYSKALEINPRDIKVLQKRVLCYKKTGELEKEIEDINKIIDITLKSEDNPKRFFDSAKIKQSLGYPFTDSIINDFSRALDLHRNANTEIRDGKYLDETAIKYSTELTKSIVELKNKLSEQDFEKLLAYFTMCFISTDEEKVKSFLKLIKNKEGIDYKALYSYCWAKIEFGWHLNKAKALKHIEQSLNMKIDFQDAKELKKVIEKATVTQPVSQSGVISVNPNEF